MPSTNPTSKRLAERFSQAGIELTDRQTEQFWAYHQHLRARNPELNMTRIHEFEAMVLKLYIDSAIVGKFIEPPSPLLDIGTGPGFPGIPLAILHPDVQFLLSEGRHKRNEFLEEVVDLLRLDNVEILGHRIAPEFDRPVNGVITRAVEAIPETLYRTLRCLAPGGRAIFMKGPECDDEIAAAQKLAKYYRLTEDHSYRLLETDNLRRLVVFERTGTPAPQPAKGAVVTSADNARYKQVKRLQNSRQIRKSGLAVAYAKAALEIMELEPQHVEQVIAREGAILPSEAAGLPATVLSSQLFDEALPHAGGAYATIVKVPQLGEAGAADFGPHEGRPLLVLGYADPADLGAALRTAAALGWRRVLLTRECAHPLHPESLRYAGASVFQLDMLAGPPADALPASPPEAYRVAASGDLPRASRLLFFGTSEQPAWPRLGTIPEIPLETGALMAAVLVQWKGDTGQGQAGPGGKDAG